MKDALGKHDRHALVIIDPQNDFCDPRGALYVPGADEDMQRLAHYIRVHGKDYTNVYISMDCHDKVAIFHPKYWVDAEGNHPAPFSIVTREDLESGAWTPSSRGNMIFTKRTYELMSRKGENAIMIWPEHCVVSTWGNMIYPTLHRAVDEWCDTTGNSVRYIFKGESPYHEEFSIFDGPDGVCLNDRATEELLARLTMCASVDFVGEAISHCVIESVMSYVDFIGTRTLGKHEVSLLTDCTSPVTGFDRAECEARMAARGVQLKRTR